MFESLVSSPFKTAFLSFGLLFAICEFSKRFRRWTSKRSSLRSKVVLLTGASSGLGYALAHVFYKKGCKLVIASRRVEELEKLKRELIEGGVDNPFEPKVLQLDLSDLQRIHSKAKEAIGFYGEINILVNNAGISSRGSVEDTTLEVDQEVMTTNYFGHIALTKAILPSMLAAKSGDIVVISSVQGKIAIPFRSAYAASKFATMAFFECLRAELVDTGINICVAIPGYINTNLSLNAVTGDGSKYGVMDQNTSSGMDAFKTAEEIVTSMQAKEKEVTIAPVYIKVAILLRSLLPEVYFKIMEKRAKSGYRSEQKSQ